MTMLDAEVFVFARIFSVIQLIILDSFCLHLEMTDHVSMTFHVIVLVDVLIARRLRFHIVQSPCSATRIMNYALSLGVCLG